MEFPYILLSTIVLYWGYGYLWTILQRNTRQSLSKALSKQDIAQQELDEKRDIKNRMSTFEVLKKFRDSHEVANCFFNLLEQDGAGEWPPRVVYDSWPAAIQPYRDIYLELVHLLPCADPMISDQALSSRREKFRSSMRTLLTERINNVEVEDLLTGAEAGNWTRIRRDQLNGLYCAVAVLRHAYRWAIIPVVKIAQAEKVVNFPAELDAPWAPLQRYFGCAAESGNNTANVLHNHDITGQRQFKINVGMSDEIVASEESFFRLFYVVEYQAVQIYSDMMKAIIAFENGDKETCLRHLRQMTPNVQNLFRIFYEGVVESKISRKLWLSYCQGFQGWGVGRMIDGTHVKYDGVSGNHVLIFQTIDAFFGMDRYLYDENMRRYIPVRQREFANAVRKHSIRRQIPEGEDVEIVGEINRMVQATRLFRAAHKTRVIPYLEQPAPERLIMTAGKSVLESSDTRGLDDALEPLKQMMQTRLQETV